MVSKFLNGLATGFGFMIAFGFAILAGACVLYMILYTPYFDPVINYIDKL